MRILAVLAIIMLAGCSTPTPAEPDPDPGEPIVENPLGPLPDALSITDSGDLMAGVDQEWNWEIDPRVKAYDVIVTLSGMSGVPLTLTTDVTTVLYHNGTHVDGTGQGSGTTGITVSGGTAPATPIFTYTQRISNTTLADQAGTWALTLDASPNVASYEITVTAIYKA